jgi:hypothetical protein
LPILFHKLRNIGALRQFIRNELGNLLIQIGDQELQAAARALSDASSSSSPDRELESAITCLRLAQLRYLTVLKPKTFVPIKEKLLSRATLGIARPARLIAAERAVEVALLLAACYHVLGDVPLVKRFTGDALSAYDILEKLAKQHEKDTFRLTGFAEYRFLKKQKQTRSAVTGLCRRLSEAGHD